MSKMSKFRSDFGHNADESMARPKTIASGDGTPVPRREADPRYDGVDRAREGNHIPISSIRNDPAQPRTGFDDDGLRRLAASLKAHGQIQPISVRWDGVLKLYVIISGERRWRAARLAGLERLHCVVVEEGDLSAILEQQLIENCLREDLTPMEEAHAFRRLMDANDWTYTEAADRLNMSGSVVHSRVALLGLDPSIQVQVERGDIPPTTAAEIASVEDPEEQLELARDVVERGATRTEILKEVRKKKRKSGRKAKKIAKGFEDEDTGVKVSALPGMEGDRVAAILRKIAEKAEHWTM